MPPEMSCLSSLSSSGDFPFCNTSMKLHTALCIRWHCDNYPHPHSVAVAPLPPPPSPTPMLMQVCTNSTASTQQQCLTRASGSTTIGTNISQGVTGLYFPCVTSQGKSKSKSLQQQRVYLQQRRQQQKQERPEGL